MRKHQARSIRYYIFFLGHGANMAQLVSASGTPNFQDGKFSEPL